MIHCDVIFGVLGTMESRTRDGNEGVHAISAISVVSGIYTPWVD